MIDPPSIKLLKDYYNGFYISDPVGNNMFSYDQRRSRKIYVPEISEGLPKDLSLGDQIAFGEYYEGKEIKKKGLKTFLYLDYKGKDVFIFDNHNHAFFFWFFGRYIKKIPQGSILWHVDQHSDMREPEKYFNAGGEGGSLLQKAFDYTNFTLNVGNFIQPALRLNIFSHVEIISRMSSFQLPLPEKFILDVDLDIFAKEMEYINTEYKIEKIKNYINKAEFITMATSPYFINQKDAIKLVKILLKD